MDTIYQTTPAESELWRWMEQAATEAARVRRQQGRFDLFEKHMDLYHGRHYPDTMPSYRPPVTVNELRTLILSEANDLSDMNLRIYVMKDPRTGGRDEQVERAFRANWVREQIDLKIIGAIVWHECIGTGFLRVGWDPNGSHGRGDLTVDDIDPRHVLPDPDAWNDRKMKFVIYESVLDLSDIRNLFPVKGQLVRPDDRYSARDLTVTDTGNISSTLSPGQPYMGPLSGSSLIGSTFYGYKRARARVLDCYVEDDSYDTKIERLMDPTGLPLRDDNNNEILQEQKVPRYPKGRRIVGANGIILYDGPNTNPGGDNGLVRVALEPTLAQFWGEGFIQQTGELQLAADKLASGIVENSIRLNNGLVIAKGNTGLDWESFSSIPAQIMQINQGSEVQIVYPPPMPPDMVQAPWRFLDMQRRILGFSDPRTGSGGRGNVSPELTETEISQSQGATRLRAKHLYHAVQRLAELMFSRMAYGYTTRRAIPAVEGEAFKPVIWEPIENPDRYAVYVDPASFQVMSRSMLRRLSLALYRMQAIDRKAALEQLGWPDWEETSKRIDQAEQAMAMAKLQSKKK